MFAALLGILWLAVRSARVVMAILVTTLVGLVFTAAIGLLATTRFNLISVAFIPLFVGLGVDFSIQFSVRSLAERLIQPSLGAALTATGTAIGRALALSAAAIGAGFFAFLPTSYVGVAELGTIAGLGMIVAFVLSVVLLPALLILLRPPSGRMAEVGFTMLAPVDAFVLRHRRGVLAAALVAAIVSCALLPLVRFDFDPLNLRSSKVEVDGDPARPRIRSRLDGRCDRHSRPVAGRVGAPGAPPRCPAGGVADRHAEQLRARPAEGKTGADRQRRGGAQARSWTPRRSRRPPTRCCSTAWRRRPLRCDRRRPAATDPAAGSARRLADVLERLQSAAPDDPRRGRFGRGRPASASCSIRPARCCRPDR